MPKKINLNKKANSNYILFIFLIIFLIIYIIYYYNESNENANKNRTLNDRTLNDRTLNDRTLNDRTLEKDGFVVLFNNEYNKTTNEPCHELKNDVLKLLPKGYNFIDYIYKINNVALSTFHRDVTSSQKIFNTKHKVYTLILYKYDGDLLSLCPGSNNSYPFVWSRIVNFQGIKGTAFLFDCDVLHAGCINQCKERHVIQYKLCHDDDLDKLSHLVGVRTTKDDICKDGIYYSIMRKLSYFFEFPINYIFYPLMTKRESDDTIIGTIQSFIPVQYYNNA